MIGRVITASGAVVVRREVPELDAGPDAEPLVLVVHRPRYDDWSLPKGKTEYMESLPATAVREVAEETGVAVRLGPPLDRSVYPTSAGTKQVDWWLGHAVSEQSRPPDDEVDDVAWLPYAKVAALLSYREDRALLEQAVEQPVTVPLVLLRHAKAMDRKDWKHPDQARPVNARGRTEARRLVDLLGAYGIGRVVSSAAVRCVSTVTPYATAAGLRIRTRRGLTEERGSDDPVHVAKIVRRLRRDVVDDRVPTVLCGHRPVFPHILDALDLPQYHLRPAEAVVVHLALDGTVHAVERHRVPH